MRRPLAIVVCILLGACESHEPSRAAPRDGAPRRQAPATPPPSLPPRRELTVLAASSLREAFTTLAGRFETAHPGTHVTLSFGGSQELRVQVENGAPADVFAAADRRNMAGLGERHLAAEPMIFARNVPVIIVPRGNPAGIHGIDDLDRARRLVIGAPEVPIGAYTLQVLDAATARRGAAYRRRIDAHVASRELNVRQVLAKVGLGEADAGIVYRTDARAADTVEAFELPRDLQVVAEYPIAVLREARQAELARAWVEAVMSPEGQAVLQARGFLPAAPPPS